MNSQGKQLTAELAAGAAIEELLLHVHASTYDTVREIVEKDLQRAAEKREAECSTNGAKTT